MKKTLLFMLMLVSLAGFRTSTSRTISGNVYDEQKAALIGAAIKIEGTNTAVSTDIKGHYSIVVPEGKTILSFSYIGYVTQQVKIGKADTINVYLKADQNSLSEVVVTGYGTQNKRDGTSGRNLQGKSTGNSASQTTASDPNKIVYKTDVVEYKASDYKVKPNATPNELLKNIQGLEVGADGSVSHQGQQVTKVRLNGKDYVGGNIAQATQNLPASIVEKIQVIDSYGNQASRATPGTESYARIIENKFEDPKTTPLSTFSADVDAASYSNVRRFINSGQLPPKNAVRIEEMINYFHYDLPEPERGKPVAIQTELSAAPWNAQHQLVRIGLKAKDVEKSKLPPSNLVFLLDVSGSMAEANKLSLVKPAMKMLVDQLRPVDHVAIVVYAGDAGIKLESTPGNEKEKIKNAIDNLYASGSTAGGAGIMLAYQIAKQKFIKGGNNRIILATDGDFNVGASSDKDMEQLIEEERGSGVSISILGFGMGNLKDSKMERMADKGHGNYAYIDNITEATKSMVSEFGGTLFTVAKDVKLQVEFNPAKVQAYRLLGYEDRLMAKEDFNNDSKVAGDMGVNHTVTALYEIIPVGVKDSFTNSVDPLKYQKPAETKSANTSSEVMTVKFRYKDPESEVSKLESVVVDDKPVNADKTSVDFRFAAAVAEYGLLLRNSQFKQNANFDQLISMAKTAKGKDDDGYRAEFIRLAESTKQLMKSAELATAGK